MVNNNARDMGKGCRLPIQPDGGFGSVFWVSQEGAGVRGRKSLIFWLTQQTQTRTMQLCFLARIIGEALDER
jgi:hypothetical protein